MGYNYSCIAIDRNIESKVEEFLEHNRIFVKPTSKTVSIESALDGDQSKEIDAYFTDKGTILFIPNEMSLQYYTYPDTEVMTFSYYETTMAFTIILTKDGTAVREIMEAEGEIHLEEGSPLSYEEGQKSVSDWISEKVEDMTGFKMFGYDDDAICIRYNILKEKEKKGFFARLFS